MCGCIPTYVKQSAVKHFVWKFPFVPLITWACETSEKLDAFHIGMRIASMGMMHARWIGVFMLRLWWVRCNMSRVIQVLPSNGVLSKLWNEGVEFHEVLWCQTSIVVDGTEQQVVVSLDRLYEMATFLKMIQQFVLWLLGTGVSVGDLNRNRGKLFLRH